jgi:hypothetical protein
MPQAVPGLLIGTGAMVSGADEPAGVMRASRPAASGRSMTPLPRSV